MYCACLLEPLLQVVGLEHADLGVEAVEERDVARLVGDLRAQEDPHVLVGRARIIGPSSAATRCSPMKNEDSPYMRWKRSSASMRSCQSMRSCVKSMSCVAHCWRSHSS